MSLETFRDEILQKEEVINTYFPDQFINTPQDVESTYNFYYRTHIPLSDNDGFTQRIIRQLSPGHSTVGAVVAPYGYGKTSTLIFAWKKCQENGILTVPPFVCRSLQDIQDAVYGWLRFKIGERYAEDLRQIYQSYVNNALDAQVKKRSMETGVNEYEVRIILQRVHTDGDLILELTPHNLLQFLIRCTNLAKQAGFKGLLIFADEFQQFMEKPISSRSSIQTLRDIVWAILSHGNQPLGMIFCMPDGTESILQEDGADVLDRLKQDHLYTALRNIYGSDFPHQLWNRYVEFYNVKQEAEQVLDRHVLTAAGQIAAREDLGRGPRTVINIFRCAFRHYTKTKEQYTVLTLIDDFLDGQIAFDTPVNSIRQTVQEVYTLLAKQITSETHRRAIKLWAAFPEHGCPDEVLEAYGAKEAADELAELPGVHGPLLTYLSVGYTFRKLASFTPGGTVIERIARDFRLSYKQHDRKWDEAALTAFIKHVLPRIFEKKQWGALPAPTSIGRGYSCTLTGSYVDTYPKRVVDLSVVLEPTHIEPRRVEAHSDFQIDILLWQEHSSHAGRDPGRIEFVADNSRWIRFTLNMAHRKLAGTHLPQDLRNLKSSINPNLLTPHLMLALIDYVERWPTIKPDNHILEGERGSVNAMIDSLLNYAINVLFSDELKATFPAQLEFVGVQIVREIFIQMCQSAYPPNVYHTLLKPTKEALRDYRYALGRLSTREKRGDTSIKEQQKQKLAQLFSPKGSITTFENRARNDYACLMKYQSQDSARACVQLQLHPLETFFLQHIDAGTISHKVNERKMPAEAKSRLLEAAFLLGYRDEECHIALELLQERGLIQENTTGKIVYRLPTGPSSLEVGRQLQKLVEDIRSLPQGLITDREREQLQQHLLPLQSTFSPDLDEEKLEDMAVTLGHIDAKIVDFIERKRASMLEQINKERHNLQKYTVTLNRNLELLSGEVPAGLDFRRHVISFQEVLRQEQRKLSSDINKSTALVENLSGQLAGSLNVSGLVSLHQSYTQMVSEVGQLDKHIDGFKELQHGMSQLLDLLKFSDQLYKMLEPMPDLRRRLTDEIVPEIMHTFTRAFDQRDMHMLIGSIEPFRFRFEELQREYNTRTTAENTKFLAFKQHYIQWLAAIGVERPDFPARYNSVEHLQSYQDVYSQVKKIAAHHLHQLQERSKALKSDLWKARYIHQQKLSEEERAGLASLEKKHTAVEQSLQDLQNWIAHTEISQVSEANLETQAGEITSVQHSLQEIDEIIRRLILKSVEPQTDEERKIIGFLANRREVDLTELIVGIGNDLSLEALTLSLLSLYQGNQVIIRVQKRG
jgi:hypothetical protein